MIKEIPQISVRIITYNQEKLIASTIESVISQKDYVHEIVICDDCSTDKTWEVILNYTNKYSDLIKPYRNKYNLGIIQNNEKRWSLPAGDINYDLSGDDEVGQGWFKKVIEYIQENNIDYKNELFCIYGDSICIYPNGDSFVLKNKAIRTKLNPLKLYERGMINNRSTCYSRKVLNKFKNISQGRSLVAENALESQLHIFSEKTYYLPFVGNVYKTGVGVSSNLNSDAFNDYELTMVYAFKFFKRIGIEIDKYDAKLPEYNISVKRMRKQKSLISILNVLKSYLKSYDPNVGFHDIQFKKYFFFNIKKSAT